LRAASNAPPAGIAVAPAAMIAEPARGTNSSNAIAVSRMSNTGARLAGSNAAAASFTPASMMKPPALGLMRAKPLNWQCPRMTVPSGSAAVSYETTRTAASAACWAPRFWPRST
jgi:hypothetical protein